MQAIGHGRHFAWASSYRSGFSDSSLSKPADRRATMPVNVPPQSVQNCHTGPPLSAEQSAMASGSHAAHAHLRCLDQIPASGQPSPLRAVLRQTAQHFEIRGAEAVGTGGRNRRTQHAKRLQHRRGARRRREPTNPSNSLRNLFARSDRREPGRSGGAPNCVNRAGLTQPAVPSTGGQ